MMKAINLISDKKYLISAALIFFLYYYFSGYFYLPAISPFREGLILYAWAIIIIIRDILFKQIPLKPLQVSLALIAIAGAISLVLQEKPHNIEQICGWLHFVMLSYIFVSYSYSAGKSESRKTIILLSKIYVYSMTVVFTICFLIYLFGINNNSFLFFPSLKDLVSYRADHSMRYFGLFMHPVIMASNAILTIILSLFLAENKMISKILVVYISALSVCLIYLSDARSALVEGVFLLLYGFLRLLRHFYPGKKAWKLFFLIIGFCMVCGILIFHAEISDYFSALHQSFSSNEYSDLLTSGRIMIWKTALEAWKEKPLFGHGWLGSWAVSDLLLEYVSDCHNNFVDLMLWTGLAGTIPYISSVVFATVRLFRNRRHYSSDEEWLIMVLITTFALSMLDIVILDTNRLPSLFFYLCLGYLYYYQDESSMHHSLQGEARQENE